VKAVEDIRDMEERAVILFIFRVDFDNGKITDTHLNAEYYSRVFIEEIEHHIPRIAGSIARAFVVFNKIDKLPRDWTEKEIRDKLLEANKDSLYEIHRIFSGLMDDYYLTSAASNKNIINLLGQVGKVAVPEEKHEEYDQAIQTLKREFEVHRNM
jgi:predicted GTPase